MQTIALPHFGDSVNPAGCCPKLNPTGWDGQELQFKDNKFVRAATLRALDIPPGTGKVFARVQGHPQKAARGYWRNRELPVVIIKPQH